MVSQAQTYKADFEEERRDREAAAGQKEEEISALHLQYKQRISKLESELKTVKEEKRSVQGNLQQLQQDRTQNVCDVITFHSQFIT